MNATVLSNYEVDRFMKRLRTGNNIVKLEAIQVLDEHRVYSAIPLLFDTARDYSDIVVANAARNTIAAIFYSEKVTDKLMKEGTLSKDEEKEFFNSIRDIIRAFKKYDQFKGNDKLRAENGVPTHDDIKQMVLLHYFNYGGLGESIMDNIDSKGSLTVGSIARFIEIPYTLRGPKRVAKRNALERIEEFDNLFVRRR